MIFILVTKEWKDYEVVATGNGEKLERWKDLLVVRPDPQIIWAKDSSRWGKYDLYYRRSNTGGGSWENKSKFPKNFTVNYKGLVFNIAPTDFKHMGIFPEQAANWDFMMNKIKSEDRKIRVLNLFAYTGGASLACSKAGADVCHVDSSKGMVQIAKSNFESSNLHKNNVRFIIDDVIKFVLREQRRGSFYDAIVMDPPSYGRGTNGEVWQLEEKINYLVSICKEILTEDPLFFIINSYTTGLSGIVTENILRKNFSDNKTLRKGSFTSGDMCLPTAEGIYLPCGVYARWEKKD